MATSFHPTKFLNEKIKSAQCKLHVISEINELSEAITALGLRVRTPVMVVVGGASQINDADFDRIRSLFKYVLAPVAQKVGATVIDGGTDTGIMRLMGEARALIDGTFELVGVAPRCLTLLPGVPPVGGEEISLELNHTHFIGVPGNTWGDESLALAKLATLVSMGMPSVTIIINGGKITLIDALYNADAGRELWVISGTGRTADRLSAVVNGDLEDSQLQYLVDTGLVKVYELEKSDILRLSLLNLYQ
jgi:hypothetical protein